MELNTIESSTAEDPLNGVLLEAPAETPILPHSTGDETEWESVSGWSSHNADAEAMEADEQFAEQLPDDIDNVPHIDSAQEPLFGPESVCGRDDRVRIGMTTEFPFRATCSLLMTFGSQQYIGTGWFISYDTVATCGHCVYDKRHGWARSIRVMPGRNGNTLPYGSDYAKTLYSVKGWTDQSNQEYDYGAIKLGTSTLGRRVGYYGFGSLTTDALRNAKVNNAGYPGDKAAGSQWFNGGRATDVQARKVYYMIDTAGGQSGSSVYLKHKTHGWVGVGVHGYGGCPNSARRIESAAYQNLKAWSGR